MMRDRGFSLIEVLVAMGILSIGAAAILSLFSAAMTLHDRSIERVRATLMAEEVLSEVSDLLKTNASPDQVMGVVQGLDFSEDYPGLRPRLAIAAVDPEDREFEVQLTIRAIQGGATRVEYVTRVLRKLDPELKDRLGERPSRFGRRAVGR